ncbi:CoA transferase [Pseudonocardia kujensis]|uniref:CaiB/BaiF CoA transferase family protein n=1 Tax=Pseudonocardia kujensis TaxID=1128675 RepID=UPI001E4A3F10|nr:CoA transferase [Pseudonocardia kujensis]MCE0764590.1 CoA transferase [Pseudonocardia kujensis]
MASTSPRPLAGTRVLDFTWSVAGPTMTRYLASLGAEVIKVEWPRNADPMRSAMYLGNEQHKTLNNGSFFANLNVGKRSLTVNLRTEEGLAVVRDLVRECDVVAESFSATVLERWGLDHATLQHLNPSIVYASVSGFGHNGPHRDKNTWGPTAQAMSGISAMSGEAGAPPAGWGWSYLDVTSGYMAALGVLTALIRRQRTGEGARLDMSQVEVGISLAGPGLLESAVTGGPLRRRGVPGGNRSVATDGSVVGYRGDTAAPSGVYRTRGGGENDYCTVSVADDGHWRSLKDALGNPAWAEDPRYDEPGGRAEHQDAIDTELAAWMAGRDKYEAMDTLQRYGVPAGAVQSGRDRVENDPQLRSRGIFAELEHPHLGTQAFEGVPFRSSTSDYELEPRWPLLGADNDYVLTEVLGYSAETVSRLHEQHVLWPDGVPANPVVERSLW